MKRTLEDKNDPSDSGFQARPLRPRSKIMLDYRFTAGLAAVGKIGRRASRARAYET
jgi:hypothetical protein